MNVSIDIANNAHPAKLGDPLLTFKPLPGNIAAGFALSLICIAAGVLFAGLMVSGIYEAGGQLPWNAEKGWCWMAIIIGIFPVSLAIIAGIALAFYSRGLMFRKTEIYANGFHVITKKGGKAVSWNQITQISETVLSERPPVLKFPLSLLVPKIKSFSYLVTTSEGEFTFEGNSVDQLELLAALLKSQAELFQIPWSTKHEG